MPETHYKTIFERLLRLKIAWLMGFDSFSKCPYTDSRAFSLGRIPGPSFNEKFAAGFISGGILGPLLVLVLGPNMKSYVPNSVCVFGPDLWFRGFIFGPNFGPVFGSRNWNQKWTV